MSPTEKQAAAALRKATVAAVSGITDMDAIALSSAREVSEQALSVQDAGRATLIALSVNTVFKLGVTRVAGTREVFREVLPAFAVSLAIAVAAVILL